MNKLQKRLSILLIALILCIPAFYNGFPFLFPDTIGYITSGFNNIVGNARVWLYAGFVRHISLWETLWLVVFVQGVMVAVSINLMFKYFFKEKYRDLSFLGYSLFIAVTTGVSFHVSMIMPDIFTTIVIFSFCLLLFAKDMTKVDYGVTIVFFLFSSGTHNSNIILNVGLIAVLILGKCVKGWRPLYGNFGITGKKIAWLSTLALCAHLLICTVHYSKGGGFVATRGGAIFLFARLCDFGIAQQYLADNCGKTIEDDICIYKANLNLGRNFLWGGGSYLYKKGGWEIENENFYKGLVWDILTTPKYLKKYIICSIEGMFIQFFYYDYNPLSEMKKSRDSELIKVVKFYYPNNYLAANNSKQVTGQYTALDNKFNNSTQQFVFYLSGLFFMLLLFDPHYSEKHKAVAVLILLGMLINAFIVASLSGVYDRYQSRVSWIITLPAFWYLYYKISDFYTNSKRFNKEEGKKLVETEI